MIPLPESPDEMASLLASLRASQSEKVSFGFEAFDQVLAYNPDDLVVTVGSGLTLGRLQEHLKTHGQWLPLDPPLACSLPLATILAKNLFGSLCYRHGMMRDHLIGVKAVTGDGRLIKSGGKVVKNVAGYDLCKLFIGANHSLGIVTELTLRLRPLPVSVVHLSTECGDAKEAEFLIASLRSSAAPLAIIDLHPVDGALRLNIRLEGTPTEVEEGIKVVSPMGFVEVAEQDALDAFCRTAPDHHLQTYLPASLSGFSPVRGEDFFHAGSGVRRTTSLPHPSERKAFCSITDRLKAYFDPTGVLPPVPSS